MPDLIEDADIADTDPDMPELVEEDDIEEDIAEDTDEDDIAEETDEDEDALARIEALPRWFIIMVNFTFTNVLTLYSWFIKLVK